MASFLLWVGEAHNVSGLEIRELVELDIKLPPQLLTLLLLSHKVYKLFGLSLCCSFLFRILVPELSAIPKENILPILLTARARVLFSFYAIL